MANLRIYSVGGFSEVGKNMACLETGDDAFIFDEGFYLPAIIELEEREKLVYSERKLAEIRAIPDDRVLFPLKHKVRAQFLGHAHLDHIGAAPFISDKYHAPIYGTPFTISVLDSIMRDSNISLRNPIKIIQPNTFFTVKGKARNYRVEFINMTHSTPQTSCIAVKTEKGYVVYANDFKLDDNPVLGPKPNYLKLREIAKEGVYAVIIDSLYSGTDRKTPSEKIARALLEEVMLTIQNRNSGVIVTTFSSHIARLKSIVDFGKIMHRKILFFGRSLAKYVRSAQQENIESFRDVKIIRYRNQVEKALKDVEKNRQKYLVVCTGHQGEPGSIMERISKNLLPLKISKDDNIIFSSSVIPTDINRDNFAAMEERLRKRKARIFRDVHVSGHAGREDLRDFLKLLSPQHVIPAHGGTDKTTPMVELCSELGYKTGKQCHQLKDGEMVEI